MREQHYGFRYIKQISQLHYAVTNDSHRKWHARKIIIEFHICIMQWVTIVIVNGMHVK